MVKWRCQLIDVEEWDDTEVDVGADAGASAVYGMVYGVGADAVYDLDEADDLCDDCEVFQVMDDEAWQREICHCIRQYWIQEER